MIYYRPQILFLLCARQLRLRSSIFFPFTAHRATFPEPPLTLPSFLNPLCSAPSLKVTDCLLYYPLVSIFTLLSNVLVSIVPEANSFGHNTSREETIILKYYESIVGSLSLGTRRWCLKSHCGLMSDSNWRTDYKLYICTSRAFFPPSEAEKLGTAAGF